MIVISTSDTRLVNESEFLALNTPKEIIKVNKVPEDLNKQSNYYELNIGVPI